MAEPRVQTQFSVFLVNKPGVLAQVTAALGKNHISVSAMLQHENSEGGAVPVVITTHSAREGAMQAALKEIDGLGTITPPAVCLRIVDQPKEFGGK